MAPIDEFTALQHRFLCGERLSWQDLTRAGQIGQSIDVHEVLDPRFKGAVDRHFQTQVVSWTAHP